MQLVFLHYHHVPVRNFIHDFIIGQMQIFNERCNLSEKARISYGLCFAVRLVTFLDKADSLIKFSTETSE